jgi:hypothetical protein
MLMNTVVQGADVTQWNVFETSYKSSKAYPNAFTEVEVDVVFKQGEMMQTMPDAPDPLCTVMKEGGPYHFSGQLRSYCDFLRKTGRDWAIPELKKRHPEEFQN